MMMMIYRQNHSKLYEQNFKESLPLAIILREIKVIVGYTNLKPQGQ